MKVPYVGNKKAEAILAAADKIIAAKSFAVAVATDEMASTLCDWFTIDGVEVATARAAAPPEE